MKKLRFKNEDGLSLVELMIVVAIIAILTAIMIPGVLAYLPSYRLKAAAQDLVGNFQLAKVSAIKSNTLCTVVFNQAVDGETYDYVIFREEDPANNNWMEYDDGDEIIRKVKLSDYQDVSLDTSESGDGLTFSNNDDGKPAVAFRPDGLTRTNNGGFGAGTVHLVNTKGVKRRVVISSFGRARMTDGM